MNEDQVIASALAIIEGRLQKTGVAIGSPADASNFLILKLADRKAEVFAGMFLTNRHRLIEYREMFQGTIDGTSVYPREVVRAVIELNAAAVIFAHNHPSQNPEPSDADLRITQRLVSALDLIDVRVLDHMIVGGTKTVSLAAIGAL